MNALKIKANARTFPSSQSQKWVLSACFKHGENAHMGDVSTVESFESSYLPLIVSYSVLRLRKCDVD
jgi:hypothetical protein